MVAAFHVQRVVAHRQVRRQHQVGFGDELAVDLTHLGFGHRVELQLALEGLAVLQDQRDLRGFGDTRAQRHMRLLAHRVQHGRVHKTQVLLMGDGGDRLLDRLRGGCVDSKGPEDRNERFIGNLVEVSRQSSVTSCNAHHRRQTHERACEAFGAFFHVLCHKTLV